MSPNNFCCAFPHQRVDSPEPPSRLPTTIDGIFAAAALPEDHPHALRFPEKIEKPELNRGIVRSPSVADKIKSQFRRKSMNVLRNEREYDGDARPLTSPEVINNVQVIGEEDVDEKVEPASDSRVDSMGPLEVPVTPAGRETETDVRMSMLRGLEWLKPLVLK